MDGYRLGGDIPVYKLVSAEPEVFSVSTLFDGRLADWGRIAYSLDSAKAVLVQDLTSSIEPVRTLPASSKKSKDVINMRAGG